jgi:hypothetical protein
VIAKADRAYSFLEEGGETSLAVSQRQRHQIATVEVEQVKYEIDEVGPTTPFCRVLESVRTR